MFVRRISIQRIDSEGALHPCPIHWIDNFAMRNFTNEAVFDDTLPVGDGLLEAGHRVLLERLQVAMEDWFRRRGYLKRVERLEVRKTSFPMERGMVVPLDRFVDILLVLSSVAECYHCYQVAEMR